EDVTSQAIEDGSFIDLYGRGAAYLDYNHDGKLDICVGSLTNYPGKTTPDFMLLKNITPESDQPRHWLEMRFTAKRTAKEAIGTNTDVWETGNVHTRQFSTGGGYGSQISLMQHVGLGKAAMTDSIVIYWPADRSRHRQIDRNYNAPADKIYTVTENMKPY